MISYNIIAHIKIGNLWLRWLADIITLNRNKKLLNNYWYFNYFIYQSILFLNFVYEEINMIVNDITAYHSTTQHIPSHPITVQNNTTQ